MVKVHSNSKRGRKEGNVLFNDSLNTFYLRLYGVRHMVKDHPDSGPGTDVDLLTFGPGWRGCPAIWARRLWYRTKPWEAETDEITALTIYCV